MVLVGIEVCMDQYLVDERCTTITSDVGVRSISYVDRDSGRHSVHAIGLDRYLVLVRGLY